MVFMFADDGKSRIDPFLFAAVKIPHIRVTHCRQFPGGFF
jgi:hypothetical protein